MYVRTLSHLIKLRSFVARYVGNVLFPVLLNIENFVSLHISGSCGSVLVTLSEAYS